MYTFVYISADGGSRFVLLVGVTLGLRVLQQHHQRTSVREQSQDVTKSGGFLDAGRLFVLDGFGFSCAGTNTATFEVTLG